MKAKFVLGSIVCGIWLLLALVLLPLLSSAQVMEPTPTPSPSPMPTIATATPIPDEEGKVKQHCIPRPRSRSKNNPNANGFARESENIIRFRITDPSGSQAAWLAQLAADAFGTFVHSGTWVAEVHDCDDFATELGEALRTLGYSTTFTAYWCLDKDGRKYKSGHAVTDVHAPDGTVTWIEPQNARIISAQLDFDGDGYVEAVTGHDLPHTTTDGNCRIEVYADRAAAESVMALDNPNDSGTPSAESHSR